MKIWEHIFSYIIKRLARKFIDVNKLKVLQHMHSLEQSCASFYKEKEVQWNEIGSIMW